MSVVRTTLLDGSKGATFHFSIENEVGDLLNYVLIDPAEFDAKKLTVTDVMYALVDFSAKLHFDLDIVEGKMVWSLPANVSEDVCFDCCGGLKDRADIDGDGKLRLTTSGITPSSQGSLIIKVRKDQS